MNEICVGRVSGRYKIEAHTLDETGEIVSSRIVADWFPNLITDQGLNQMGNLSTYLSACQVGTGNTPPTFADTGLATYLAGTSTTQSRTRVAGVAPNYESKFIGVWRFATGTAAGNLTEVGIGTATSGSVLFSRALILDGMGNPTTITVLPTEVLDVTYELQCWPPLADQVGVITISGINYNYTLRPARVNLVKDNITLLGWGVSNSNGMPANNVGGNTSVYPGVLGPITGSPTGGSTSANTVNTPAAYSAGSFLLNFNMSFAIGEGNIVGGISCIETGFSWCNYQIQFTPPIPKDNTKTLVISFRHTWARH